MNSGPPYKVLVVDDSRAICKFLVNVLSADPRLTVVGHALDAFAAGDLLRQLSPDVMTLDVEMPGMDGLTFLRKIMRTRPLPVLMLSSLTDKGAAATLDALEAGAVDFLLKRSVDDARDLASYSDEIVRRVCNAATVTVGPWTDEVKKPKPLPDLGSMKSRLSKTAPVDRAETAQVAAVRASRDVAVPAPAATQPSNPVPVTPTRLAPSSGKVTLRHLVGFGASTGGPEALRKVLTEFYAPDCAVVISQHMPERFMVPFAERLNTASRFTLEVATDGQLIEPGCGYIAPGEQHLKVDKRGTRFYCSLSTDEPVNGHRPSVDVMFDSLSESAAGCSVGVLLTGMGEDGARGLKNMHDGGAPTIIQDKFSSAVWGMPGTAYELGAADQSLSLESVGPALNAVLGGVLRQTGT